MTPITTNHTNTLSFTNVKLYIASIALATANVLAPIVLHQFGQTGQVLLPIYFFSLVAGLKFGWRCGLITALLSPMVSFWLTAMPARPIIGLVIVKSIMLGTISGLLAQRSKNTFWVSLLTVVITQVSVGALSQNFTDITIGYPGLALQVLLAPTLARPHSQDEN